MRCPTLQELPAPPLGRTGWPWTTETPQLPVNKTDGSPWPRISITTPSFNQGHYLEETIRSVLLQGYPDLEYMVFDGGSTDNSIEIIKKYSPWLICWESVPDRGQAHAINKGFSRSTGSLIAWINSDDLFLPNAFRISMQQYALNPHSILLGDVENFIDEGYNSYVIKQKNVSFPSIILPMNNSSTWHQPGSFVPSFLRFSAGLLDEDLRYVFDVDWLIRLLQKSEVLYLKNVVARFRIHDSSKTTAEFPLMMKERHNIAENRYWNKIPSLDIEYACALNHLEMAGIYLAKHSKYKPYWNRVEGIRELTLALIRSRKIITLPDFQKLCRRSLLPTYLLRSKP